MFLSTKKNYPNAGPNTSTVWEVKPHIFKFLFISTLHFPSLCFNTNFKDDLKQNLEVTIIISSRLESFQTHLKNTECKRSYIFQFEL